MSDPISHRPSRQFIIRGSIAISIVAVILLLQTQWVRTLFVRTPKDAPLDTTTTVGDVMTQDTNRNGIADWEEKLWGLDPTVLYTNGVSNQQIIEQKKKALRTPDASEKPQNETDRLARELFTLAQSLGQSETVDDSTIAEIARKLGASVQFEGVANRYSAKDMKTVPTSTPSVTQYYQAMTAKVVRYETSLPDIEILARALETGDMTEIPNLLTTAERYYAIAKELVTVPVPISIAKEHLDIVNSFGGIADAFVLMQEIDDNATKGLVGVAVYNTYNQKLTTALATMRDYFTRYGILSS